MKVQILSTCIVLGSPCVPGEIRDFPREQADSMIRSQLAKQVSEELSERVSQSEIRPDAFDVERARRDEEEKRLADEHKVQTRQKSAPRRAVTRRDA